MVNIIDFEDKYRQDFIKMCDIFYESDAVLHRPTTEDMNVTYDVILESTPLARGLLFIIEDKVVGYALLAFTYSNECGGIALMIEEVYVKQEYRSQGVGKIFFEWIFAEYDNKVKRYLLEVTEENKRAFELYKKIGFKSLDYKQLIIDK